MRRWAPLLLLLLVVFTNRLLVDDPDMSIKGFDSISYLDIARKFPGLPSWDMPHQHAQRLVGPWVVGALSRISPLSLEWTFELVTFLLLLLILQVTWRTCERLGVEASTCLIISAMLAFNPYFSRFYFSIPTYVGDLIFLLGLSLLIQALLFVERPKAIYALALAAVGRQSALLLLPAFCLWILVHPQWKRIQLAHRLFVGAAGIGWVSGLYLATDRLASQINPVSINSEHVFGLIHWIEDIWKGVPTGISVHEVPLVPKVILAQQNAFAALGAFLVRGFLSLVIPSGVLLACTGLAGLFRGRDLSFSLLLFMCATICAQPFLAGPALTGHPVVRLGMLCLPALVIALALTQVESKLKIAWDAKGLVVLLLLLFFSSWHHRYTYLAGSVDHSAFFAVFYIGCAALIFLIFRHQRLKAR